MRNLKRALSLGLTAAMISGLMVMGSSAASYADVTSENNVEAIDVLQAVGIMVGDENGNFNPDQNVTRNEMAVVMSNLMAYNVASYRDTSPFTDVPSWAEPYVAACYTNGITAGTSATTYGGSENVTTAQAALMVMKALGYFQYQQDFGDDWQLATVAQGNRIDLFTDVDSGVRDAMTRNDVAQLVLNALEAGTVEATTNGSITVGGVTIANSVEYSYVTSTQEYARTIHMDKSTTNYTDANSFIVELGEKLYQGDLTLDSAEGEGSYKAPNLDVFGRPANTWEYQAKEIGTYADEADYTFTGKVTSKELYDVVGSTAASRNYSWTVTVDGETVPYDGVDLNDNKTDNNDDFLQYAGFARQYRTGNGVRTNVYVDGTNRTVYVSITHYYAAEVDKVEDDYITLSNVNSYPDYDKVADSNDEFETTDEFAADDVVVYSFADGEIREVYAAESLEGEISRVRNDSQDENGDYFDIDSERYNYNATVDDDGRLVTENVGNNMVGYLDQYGYAIYIDESAITYDYAYVLSMNGEKDNFGGNDMTYYARLVLSDGTMVRAETDEDDKSLLGHIVSYTVDNNDIYSLTARDTTTNTTRGTDGTKFPTAPGDGNGQLSIAQDRASLYVDGQRYTANDNTVFIVAEEDSKLDNYDFTVYTGIKNVPDIDGQFDNRNGVADYQPANNNPLNPNYLEDMMSPASNQDNSTKAAVAANENGVAKVVYVQNADVAGTGEVIFALADQDAKKVSDSTSGSQKEIREIKAVVGGEIVTLEIKQDTDAEDILTSDVFTNRNGYLVDNTAGKQTRIVALESITYNSDGLVTDVRLYNNFVGDPDGDGAGTFTQTKKASNGTVGLGDGNGNFDSFGWYDDAIGVRFDPKAEEFSISRVSGIRDDYNDGVVAIFDSNVINGICVIENDGKGDEDVTTYTVTYPTTVSNINSITTSPSITSGNEYADGTTFTLTVVPAANYTAEVKVNGTVVTGSGNNYSITVDKDIEITVTAIARPVDEYNGDITVTMDYSNDGESDAKAWEVTSLSYESNTVPAPAPNNAQIIKAIADQVTEDNFGYTLKDSKVASKVYTLTFTDGYVDYFVKYDATANAPELEIASVTEAQPTTTEEIKALHSGLNQERNGLKYQLVSLGLTQVIDESTDTIKISGTVGNVINASNWETYKDALNQWAEVSTPYATWAEFVAGVLDPVSDLTLDDTCEIAFINVVCNGRVLVSCVVNDGSDNAQILKTTGTSNTTTELKTWSPNGQAVTVDISGLSF